MSWTWKAPSKLVVWVIFKEWSLYISNPLSDMRDHIKKPRPVCRWDNSLLQIPPPEGSFDYGISWIRGVISHNEEPVFTIRMMLHLYSYLYRGMRSGSCQVFVYVFALPQFCELWDEI